MRNRSKSALRGDAFRDFSISGLTFLLMCVCVCVAGEQTAAF